MVIKMTVKELITKDGSGGITFGNYELQEKAKVEDFPIDGDLYKVKTYSKITKLEKNGLFMYESVPGTNVEGLLETECGMELMVSGNAETQITVGLMEDTSYDVCVNEVNAGNMNTKLSGKLSLSVDLTDGKIAKIQIQR